MTKPDKKAVAAPKPEQATDSAPDEKAAPTAQSATAPAPDINLSVAMVAIERGLSHYKAFKDAHEVLRALQNLEQVKAEREQAATLAQAKADEAMQEHAAQVDRNLEARELGKKESAEHKARMQKLEAETLAKCEANVREAQARVDALAQQQAALTGDVMELDDQIQAKTAEVQALEAKLEAAKDAARKAAASVLGG